MDKTLVEQAADLEARANRAEALLRSAAVMLNTIVEQLEEPPCGCHDGEDEEGDDPDDTR
jgi:hypothetical protein